MEHGWFKMNREIFTDRILCYSPDHLSVWCYLCAHASFKEQQTRFAGKLITLQPGQLITGRKVIAAATGIDEHKVQRILSFFQSAHRIAQQTSNLNRLITILPRDEAPSDAQQTTQQMHSECTTTAQQMHTIKNEEKERKKDVNTFARTRARVREPWKDGQESVYSGNASYDLEAYARSAIGLSPYVPKHAE